MSSTANRQRSGHPFSVSRAGGRHSSANKRYHVEAPIGQGATSTVYRAVDTLAGNRSVALKVLRYEIPTEWDTLLRLQHTAIVQVRDVGSIRDPQNRSIVRPYIAMDLEPGAPLSADVREQRKLSDSLDIIKSCGRALAYLHENGIGHFDIKPSNIFIARSPLGHLNGAKILDFGLAAPLMRDGIVHEGGTFAYMSPEQIARQTVTDQSDVFSLGVVAYELLTGRHPFISPDGPVDLGRLQTALAESVPAHIRDLEPAVPTHVAQVVHKALAKQPSDRPSARQFVDLLDQLDAFEDERRRLLEADTAPGIRQIEALWSSSRLDEASEQLRVLELQGWAFSEVVLLRHRLEAARADATIADRAAEVTTALAEGDLGRARGRLCGPEGQPHRGDVRLLRLEGRLDLHARNQADAAAPLTEASARASRGDLREAEWFVGIIRGIESFDPIAVKALLTDVVTTEQMIATATDAERDWFALRSADTLTPPPHDTLAAQVVVHGHAAQRHLPTVRTLVDLLNSPSGHLPVDLMAELINANDAGTADVVRTVVEHLGKKQAALRTLRERVTRATDDPAMPAAEALQAVDDLLRAEPTRALETQRKTLIDRFDGALTDATRDRLVEHINDLCPLGEWEQVSACARLLPKGDAARWTTALRDAQETSAERTRQIDRAVTALRECRNDEATVALRAALATDPENKVLALALAAALLEQATRQRARHERASAAQSRADALQLLDAGKDATVLSHARHALAALAAQPEPATARRPVSSRPASPAPASSPVAETPPSVQSRLRSIGARIHEQIRGAGNTVRHRSITIAVVGAAVALFGIGVYISVQSAPAHQAPPTAPPQTQGVPAAPESVVTLKILPATATVTIDGVNAESGAIRLSAGVHNVVFSAPGYRAITETIVGTGEPIALSKTLTPLPTVIQFTSNLPASAARLGAQRFSESAAVEATGNAQQFTAAFPSNARVAVGFTPLEAAEPVLGTMDAYNATLVAISAFGDRITVFSGRKVRVALNDQVKGDADRKGLSFDRDAGDARLTIGDGRERIEITVPREEGPLLHVHAGIASDLGSILVTANEEGSTVTLNGKARGVVKRGRLLLQALKAGPYTVGLSKADFCSTPDVVPVTLAASGQAEAAFRVQRPMVRLTDAPAGARILFDEREVTAPGELDTLIGTHTLTAKAPGYRDYETHLQVDCSNTIVSLASVMRRDTPALPEGPRRGVVALNLTPQHTSVALYRRGGRGQEQLLESESRSTLELDPGEYRLRLSAARHEAKDVTVSVKAGETTTVTESLTPIEQTWSPRLTTGKNGVLRADALSVFGEGAAAGTYSFRVIRQGVLTQRYFGSWIVAYRSPADYAEFRVEDNRLQWRRPSEASFQPLGELSAEARKMADARKSIYVRVVIAGGSVSHEIGGDPATLTPVGSAVQLQEGQFGVAKGSQLSEFSH